MKPEINNDELTAVKEVLNTGYLTEGPVTKEFEQAVATYVGTRYAVATTSCTTALQLVLETLDIKGQEVVIPDFTYPATAEAIIHAGGKPVLVDVDLESMNITSELLENGYSENSSVCIPVSWGGVPLESDVYSKMIIFLIILIKIKNNIGRVFSKKA